ncbi:hypothetical protein PF003_g9013 [Phytophthora fragariae]|nr:hypothetical protein PF003_g9013 [Phytophthora fragariae]
MKEAPSIRGRSYRRTCTWSRHTPVPERKISLKDKLTMHKRGTPSTKAREVECDDCTFTFTACANSVQINISIPSVRYRMAKIVNAPFEKMPAYYASTAAMKHCSSPNL